MYYRESFSHLSSRLLSITSSYVDHGSFNGTENSFQKIISDEIIKMYKNKELPCQYDNKRFVAGFMVYGNYMYSECVPILVGPKPPSKYRKHYSLSFYIHS